MNRSATFVPIALALVSFGCGGSTPPAAVPEAVSPGAAAAASGAPAAAAAAAAPPPASPAAAKPGDAAAPAPGKAAATDAPILTGLTQADILAAVNKNGEAFNRCYLLGAGSNKSYRAKVTVRATVGPTGVVNTVEIVSSTAKNPKVDACVNDAFKKLSFTRPAGSGATVFTFPLSFDGAEQVP